MQRDISSSVIFKDYLFQTEEGIGGERMTVNQIAEYTRLCVILSEICIRPSDEWNEGDAEKAEKLKERILKMRKEMGLDSGR